MSRVAVFVGGTVVNASSTTQHCVMCSTSACAVRVPSRGFLTLPDAAVTINPSPSVYNIHKDFATSLSPFLLQAKKKLLLRTTTPAA